MGRLLSVIVMTVALGVLGCGSVGSTKPDGGGTGGSASGAGGSGTGAGGSGTGAGGSGTGAGGAGGGGSACVLGTSVVGSCTLR